MKSETSSPQATSNTGPLIHLAKANALHLLKKLYKTIIIPQQVKTETVNKGKEEGAPDALQIQKAIEEGWIKTEKIRLEPEFHEAAETAGLHQAEVAVIQYAYKNNTTALLDDEAARTFAQTLQIPIRGSIGIIIEATRKGLIPRQEAIEKLDKLSEIIYLSAELYKTARKTIQKLQ